MSSTILGQQIDVVSSLAIHATSSLRGRTAARVARVARPLGILSVLTTKAFSLNCPSLFGFSFPRFSRIAVRSTIRLSKRCGHRLNKAFPSRGIIACFWNDILPGTPVPRSSGSGLFNTARRGLGTLSPEKWVILPLSFHPLLTPTVINGFVPSPSYLKYCLVKFHGQVRPLMDFSCRPSVAES
ncbi:hypothetical protein PBRA_000603 [Plasmodiophora brassicae]|uniref:Uncharacterized protein n=1 Tax=Plasmodiophora brassicae TaxID=37360 RepID=A0A0G4IPK5_PLABS|nr:hypothetical protein PBRA_000603 [Plasmodiophora brassicae]